MSAQSLKELARAVVERERTDFTAGFEIGLKCGALIICKSCGHYEPRMSSRPDGWCRHYNEPAWGSLPLYDCRPYMPRSPELGEWESVTSGEDQA